MNASSPSRPELAAYPAQSVAPAEDDLQAAREITVRLGELLEDVRPPLESDLQVGVDEARALVAEIEIRLTVDARRYRCDDCGALFRYPGEKVAHVFKSHMTAHGALEEAA